MDTCLKTLYAAQEQTAITAAVGYYLAASYKGGRHAVTHPQVLTNPDFAGSLAGWTINQPAETTVTWEQGSARIIRNVAGSSPFISQVKLAVGAPYRFRMYVQGITGSVNWGPSGQTQNITTVGLKTYVIAAANITTFLISLPSQNSQVLIEWVTAERLDVSMSNLILTMRDWDGDKKQTSVQLGPVTDGTSYTTRAGEAAALATAINAVAGNIARQVFEATDAEPNDVNAAAPHFQTHIRWIIEWVDSVTGDGPYQTDIPTADVGTAGLFLTGSTEHDPAHAAWIALKSAFNGKVVNPRTGSTVNITRIFLEE